MLGKKKDPWSENQVIKLWVLYHNKFKYREIAAEMGRTEKSVEKAISRYRINTFDRRRGVGTRAQRSQRKSPSAVLKSVLIQQDLSFGRENLNWQKMPLREARWQKHAASTAIAEEIVEKQAQARLEAWQEIEFSRVIDELRRHNKVVTPLNKSCSIRQETLYLVDGEMRTPRQMIMLMNRLRVEAGLPSPLTVTGYTEE